MLFIFGPQKLSIKGIMGQPNKLAKKIYGGGGGSPRNLTVMGGCLTDQGNL